MITKIARVSTRLFAIALFSGTAIASIVLGANQPSQASSGNDFFCAVQQGIPTTFTRTSDGNKLPVVRWTSLGRLSAKERCSVVSRRFQKNYDNGTLRTIISGKINKQPVICGAASTNDGCNSRTMLFTLEPGSNPRRVVENLFNPPALLAGEIQNQSGDDTQIAIDFETYLSALNRQR